MEHILESLYSAIQSSTWIAPLIALVAGIITSFMPCSISSIPLVIGYVGGISGSGRDKKRALLLSVTFAAGMTVTFVGLALVTSGISHFFHHAEPYWFLFLGILMALMILQTLDIINLIPSSSAISKNKKKGVIGAFLSGMLGGLFSSHCATPALLMLLALVSESDNIARGMLLLATFSLGHAILTVVAGTFTGFVQRITAYTSYKSSVRILKFILAAIMAVLTIYMFYNAYVAFME